MKYEQLPAPVLAKRLALEAAVEDLTQRVAKTQGGIEHARRRLTGGFQKDQEYRDLRETLDRMVADEPVLKMKLHAAQRTLSNAKSWLDSLPAGTVLEPVDVKVDGHTLEGTRAKIKALEAELAAARAAPSADIEARLRAYVAGLAKPIITGVGKKEQLKIIFGGAGFGPSGPHTDRAEALGLFAFLFPDAMVAALMNEIEQTSSNVCPDVLIEQIEQLAFLEEAQVAAAIANGEDVQRSPSAPPAAVLGVRSRR
jgi:hypothetical protein